MRRVRIGLFVFLVVSLFACLAMAADKPAGRATYKAVLTGKDVVPPVETMAKGEATLIFVSPARDERTYSPLAYEVSASDIENVTAIHMHQGKKGANGPHVAILYGGPTQKERLSGVIAEGKIVRGDLMGPLKGKTLEYLAKLMQAKDLYIVVHTEKHPEGEIRGQLE